MAQEFTLKHDGTFDIATGRSRKETHWRNKELAWSAFLKKIAETHRTPEKLTEYMAYKKPLQDERKDVGGFVGGYVNGGRRKSENITHRQLITLDIDFSTGGIWDDFTMLYDNAAAIYSTHKHTPESPRLRLILPLDRPVAADEYVAIARRIAGNLDINCFDDTTYEPSRLMYWPSTSKDGEYVFEYQDGPWLSADKVLATYKNWRDASEWPVSDRAGEVIHREIKKQGDPLEKPGVVGAFCRTYDIHEAIEAFLDDVYEACDVEDRYTFIGGSTAAGLVVYDDKYAYSHHGTDPASGKLCNAFDLVRVHLYGLKDEDAKEGTPGNKLPSYQSMVDLSMKDKSVRKTLTAERMQELKDDFKDSGFVDDEETPEEPVDDSWQEELEIDRKGNIQGTTNNYLIILQNDPRLKGFGHNEFANTKDVLKPVPWRAKEALGHWKDSDNANLFIYLEKVYNIANEANLKRAQKAIFEERKYHPIREYLNSLTWDGEERLETVFIDYLGADDCEYVRAVTRKSLVAAVARAMVPGIKWDHSPVIVGGQGIGKSVILQKLGHIEKGWFSDNFYLRGTKEDVEQLFGNWIIEMGELAGLSKRDVNEIKSYISRREDQCRLAFSEEKGFFKRQCVFFGTTNNPNFLKDATGNRRFWPINVDIKNRTKNIFTELDEYEIDQIWAEATNYFKAGEPLFLDNDLQEIAEQIQELHSERDERTGLIQDYLDTLLPENWDEMNLWDRRNFFRDELSAAGTKPRLRTCVAEIWCECFGKDKALLDRKTSMEINDIMTKLKDWEPSKFPVEIKGYGRQRVYRRDPKRVESIAKSIQTQKRANKQSIQAGIHKN